MLTHGIWVGAFPAAQQLCRSMECFTADSSADVCSKAELKLSRGRVGRHDCTRLTFLAAGFLAGVVLAFVAVVFLAAGFLVVVFLALVAVVFLAAACSRECGARQACVLTGVGQQQACHPWQTVGYLACIQFTVHKQQQTFCSNAG